MYNVVLFSGVQQSDSGVHIHIIFHFGLLQSIEYSSLCYTVGPYYFIYSSVCLLIPYS